MNTNKRSPLSEAALLRIFFLLSGAAMAIWMMYRSVGAINMEEPIYFLFIRIAVYAVLVSLAARVQVIGHEAGHLVCGLISGYSFASFRIGSLMLVKNGDKFQFKRLHIAGTGGQCLMAPPAWKGEGVPYRLYLMGGTLANIVLSVLSLILLLVFWGNVYTDLSFGICALTGIQLAVSNGLPLRMNGLDNDGMNRKNIDKDPRLLHYFWLQLKISELLGRGFRMKQMPEEWFALPPEAMLQSPLVSTIAVFGVNRLMDGLRIPEASERITYLLDHADLLEMHRSQLKAEAIFCELMTWNRRNVVDLFFDESFRVFLRGQAGNPSIIRVMYAYALLYLRDEALAEGHLHRFETACRIYPYPSELIGERELIEMADRKAAEIKKAEAEVSSAPALSVESSEEPAEAPSAPQEPPAL